MAEETRQENKNEAVQKHPLLQEYSYEDYENIRMVLGDGRNNKNGEFDFIEKIPMSGEKGQNLFPHMKDLDDIIRISSRLVHISVRRVGGWERFGRRQAERLHCAA